MRQLIALGLAAAALSFCGCNVKLQLAPATKQEFSRCIYVENIGPLLVTSIVGESASPSGLAGLNGLCTDQMWRMKASPVFPDLDHVPSMFEAPDPNRPFKIKHLGLTFWNMADEEP
jgi:hypothetical protein